MTGHLPAPTPNGMRETPTTEPARPCPASPPAARKRPRKRRAPASATGSDSEGKYDLCEEDREWVARIASGLGPLSDRQRDILARLLHTRH
jgi:hypothetical protein